MSDDQPHAVFVIAASHHSEQQAVVLASLIASAHRIQRQQSRLNRPLWMLLDEFANVGPLPNLLDALTTLASAAVSIALGLQSTAQLDAVYGGSPAKVALEALHGYSAFPGLGFDSAQWVSDRLGQGTSTTWSKSTALDSSRQWTKGEHQRAVMLADEVSRFGQGGLIVQKIGYNGLGGRVRLYFRVGKYRHEALLANPKNPQIATVLNGMRQEVLDPPGAWDLGEQLLERLVPCTPEPPLEPEPVIERHGEPASATAIEPVAVPDLWKRS